MKKRKKKERRIMQNSPNLVLFIQTFAVELIQNLELQRHKRYELNEKSNGKTKICLFIYNFFQQLIRRYGLLDDAWTPVMSN